MFGFIVSCKLSVFWLCYVTRLMLVVEVGVMRVLFNAVLPHTAITAWLGFWLRLVSALPV